MNIHAAMLLSCAIQNRQFFSTPAWPIPAYDHIFTLLCKHSPVHTDIQHSVSSQSVQQTDGLGWIIKTWHLVCRYGAQIAFGLNCSAGAMSFYWWSHRQRPGLDVEQPLVEASGREKDGTQPSLQKVLLAAVCICLGACLCSLCGLGGVAPCNPLLRRIMTWGCTCIRE